MDADWCLQPDVLPNHTGWPVQVWEENLVAGRKMKAGALAVMFANHHQPDGFTIHGKPVSTGAPQDNVIIEDWGPGNPNTSSVKVKPSDSREGRLDI